MRVLFTGASSFTGFWFIRELVEAGHDVVALFQKRREEYSGVRKIRVETLSSLLDTRFETTIEQIRGDSFDLVSLHGAEVQNYKSQEFDPVAALEKNTRGVNSFLLSNSCKRVVVTGTVFEGISPYGLSKRWSAEWIQYMVKRYPISYGKFVIPNPFGPFEDEKLTTILVKEWKQGKNFHIQTPHYVRDNIAVTLLAKGYLEFAFTDKTVFAPSGYVTTQGEFVQRFAKEIGARLSLSCSYTLEEKQDFAEPAILINSDRVTTSWDETAFWDSLSGYYASL